MDGYFIVIALATFTAQLPGSVCFKFAITRDLNNVAELDKSKYINVEVDTNDVFVSVAFRIPQALSYSGAFIFFANEDKNILLVSFNETVRGLLYEAPYKFKMEMKGGEAIKSEEEGFHRVSGVFPQSWLPKKCNKVNAAVLGADGQYYNYYNIQNFLISLPDLMVVEEYRKSEFDIKV